MPNLFRTFDSKENSVVINEMFDLKGSIDARYVDIESKKKTKDKGGKKKRKSHKKKTSGDVSQGSSGGSTSIPPPAYSSDYDSTSSENESTDDESDTDNQSKQSPEWDIINNILRDTKIRLTFNQSNNQNNQTPCSTPCSSACDVSEELNDNLACDNLTDKRNPGMVLKDLNFCPYHGSMAHDQVHSSNNNGDNETGDDTILVDNTISNGSSDCLEEEYSLTGLHIRSKLKQAINLPSSSRPHTLSRRYSNGFQCRKLRLGEDRRAVFLANLRNDTAWLREHNIMDYSLLLGVGKCQVKQIEDEKQRHRLLYPNHYKPNNWSVIDEHTATGGGEGHSDDEDEDEEESNMHLHHNLHIEPEDKGSYWERECGGVCATDLENNERVSFMNFKEAQAQQGQEYDGLKSLSLGLPGEEAAMIGQQIPTEATELDEREWYSFF